MPSIGAEPAYRGYRLQALYALSRVLGSGESPRLVFQPEEREDLAVYNTAGELAEAIQVKGYRDNLTISSFSPQKPGSFFRRIVRLLKQFPEVDAKIVSFGPIGPEMAGAWGADGKERRSVRRKLLAFGFSADEIELLLHSVRLVKVDEDNQRDEVFLFLRESLLGGNPELAFDLLNYWLFRASEHREKITQSSLRAKIDGVGRYLYDRAAHHQEWFTSIVPVEDRPVSEGEREALSEEFYQGIAARYEHIVAGVDVVREDKLQRLEEAFGRRSVVIVHGASGQGKSTLAYRYLHDFVPDHWRFEIRLIQDRQQALRVARALSEHAKVVGAPMVIYLDVLPSFDGWRDLLRELASHRYLHFLVTVREEDWRRASVSSTDFQFESLDLAFDEAEARQLYPRLTSRRAPERFLTFEDAWRRFGSGGPLLEFVYLITQNESLRDRLGKQVQRLQDQVRTKLIAPDELNLLRLVSVASAYGARTELKALVQRLELPEPMRTLELFEREYLLRCSQDGRFAEGLHSIRSSILTDLLTDPILVPWSTIASACMPMIAESDLEVFLLHTFSRDRRDAPELLKTLSQHQLATWTGLSGVLRALLWLGVRDYVAENQEPIREAYETAGPGWIYMVDLDIANVSPGLATSSWWKDLSSIPEQMKEGIESVRQRQTAKETVFTHARKWLAERERKPDSASTLSDWRGLAEALFWVGYLSIDCPASSWISETELDEAVGTLPLDCLGDVILGLSYAWHIRLSAWLDRSRVRILDRFRQDTRSIAIEDNGEIIRTHFLVQPTARSTTSSDGEEGLSQRDGNRFHDEAMRRVELLRKLFPDRREYGCQGYGHRLGLLSLPFDDTEKLGIAAGSLPPSWAVGINSLFIRLGIYSSRPETWQDYAEAVYRLREMVLESLQELLDALNIHFRRQHYVGLLGDYIDTDRWSQCRSMTTGPNLLPRCAVDEWGFVGEGRQRRDDQESAQTPASDRLTAGGSAEWAEISFSLWEYRGYLSSLTDFTTPLLHFYWQSTHVIALNTCLGKAKSAEQQRAVYQAAAQGGVSTDLDHLSTFNLGKALNALPRFQQEFEHHFSRFFARRSLDRLNRQEQDVFLQAWSLWYQFAFRPDRIYQHAGQDAVKKLKNALAQVRRNIRRHFRKLPNEGFQVSILSEELHWESQPALWISFDVSDPTNLHRALALVMSTLQAAMGSTEIGGLQQYALDFWWPTIVAVPLIRGKSLAQTAWQVATSVLTSRDVLSEDSWWNYVPHPIPPVTWEKLDLYVWEHPRLEQANRLCTMVSELFFLVAHISDLDRLPETDEYGTKLLQDYLQDLSSDISQVLQQTQSQIAEMSEYFDTLTEEEKVRRSDLVKAIQQLTEIQETILPGQHPNGEPRISLSGSREWVQRLETALEHSELAHLHWVADVLNLLAQDA